MEGKSFLSNYPADHVLYVFGSNLENVKQNLSQEDLGASERETVLGIQIDDKLNFENYIKSFCSKASQKLGALQRISNLLDTQKKNLLFNSIIKSQFSYFPCLAQEGKIL